MKVIDRLWRETKIGGVMGMCAGRMEEFLRNSGTQESWRAGDLLPLFLWRWYFLQIPAMVSATLEAANEVDFFVPLKPTEPADFQAKTFPAELVRVIIVLLYEDDTKIFPSE